MPRLTQEDRERRAKGLGGSDLPVLLGRSKYKTPLQLYAEKRGLIDPDDTAGEAADWGHLLEPVVASEYAARHPAWLVSEHPPLAHPEHPWALATIDRAVSERSESAQRWGLEIKTRRFADGWGESGTDSVPPDVLLQCHWYMAVTGWERWDVAVLFGGSEYREYTIRKSTAMEALLLDRAEKFWRRVQEGDAPVATLPEDIPLLAKVTPQQHDEIPMRHDLTATAIRLSALRENLATLEHEKERVEAELKLAIGEGAGVRGDGWQATWNTAKDSEVVDWEQLARQLLSVHPPQAQQKVLRDFTKTKPGVRRFLFKMAQAVEVVE